MIDPSKEEGFIGMLLTSFSGSFRDILKLSAEEEARGEISLPGFSHEFLLEVVFGSSYKGIRIYNGMYHYTGVQRIHYLKRVFPLKVEYKSAKEGLFIEWIKKWLSSLPSFSYKLYRRHKKLIVLRGFYRKYLSIFFLSDPEKKIYLGRVYFYILIQKG